jgi:hypothetical protein
MSALLHCYIVLDSASMTVVYPFHAFMHKPLHAIVCIPGKLLSLVEISTTGHFVCEL